MVVKFNEVKFRASRGSVNLRIMDSGSEEERSPMP